MVEAYVRLAECHRQLGDPAAGLAQLERGRRVCGLNPVVSLPLARAYAASGRKQEAREIFTALLPTHPELKEEMAALGLR